ncbi:cytochrome P450 [Punctularia strigosozonata HHB-11173 SS5]|uniref:cytochrome P450 n=1 Tax=Punctularia strigosozonata (strain HHB-11173) TaxID=741275 RepID=UPI0004417E1A|nr:cytochrome P450 [Punctularia strigosozonata HHB-11173 SS5]EIN09540.1 cytochrome P450 [Punctularia strigosozonata HHB-11173 SS5]
MESLPIGAVGVLLVSILLFLALRRSKQRPPLPPGPKGLPLIGNLLDMPTHYPWKTYVEWGRRYCSDVVHIQLLGFHLVVINTARSAAELLDKKSTIYSDRPWLTMMCDLANHADWDIALMSNNARWKASRVQYQRVLSSERSKQWRRKQTLAAYAFGRSLLDAPGELFKHTRYSVGSNILNVTYDIHALPNGDPWINLAERANEIGNAAISPGSYLVDVFPKLKYLPSWFPGTGFKRDALEFKKVGESLLHDPYDHAKRMMLTRNNEESIVSELLGELDDSATAEQRREVEMTTKRSTSVLYGAGAETNVAALNTFFLAMLLYPDVQENARKEVSRVTKEGRLPDFSDDLPYIRAIAKECLRWRPPVPLGIPHRVTQDDVGLGYRIPKGSIVAGNIWAILHDEHVYPHTSEFDPNRFMGSDPNPDPDAVFGFGRRICPGRFFAIDALWIMIATTVAAFDIEKALDADGRVEEPTAQYTSGFQSRPLPFKCTIKPRTLEMALLVRLTAPDST